MNHGTVARTTALAVVLAVTALEPRAAAAQAPAASARAVTAVAPLPCTPWGDPDLQGTWSTDHYIPLDAGPRPGSAIRQYIGDSRGRWEGDTLVVETANFTDHTSIGFNGNGLRHSDAMRHVERFRRVDADTIEYQVTVEDPKTYTAPFTIGLAFTTQPGYQVYEYACHEGNYGMTNILSGARADEAAATK